MASGPPRVVHLSHFDEYGGAGRSAYRLHDGLRRLGVDSHMIVGSKTGQDTDVAEIPPTFADRLFNRAGYETGVQYAYVPSSRTIGRHPWFKQADVVQLANIHGGFFSHLSLPRLTHRKHLFWCIHDMWSFTGHCGYSYDCERWLNGCGSCPHLDTYPAVRRDATRLNWRLKDRLYRRLDLTIVAPSKWLGALAQRSALTGRFPVHVIPYGVDTDLFSPSPRADARRQLGLDPDEQIVLVAGIEPRKGSDLLGDILAVVQADLGHPVSLVVAGGTANASPPAGFATRVFDSLDEPSMRLAYAAADVYLLPTRYDNLPNTVLEALACGTAVVATDVGGIPDVIDDGVNGFVRPVESEALGHAVAQVLADTGVRDRLGAAGRVRCVKALSLERQARSYLELYDAARG